MRKSFLSWSILPLICAAVAACDSDPPIDNGVRWECAADVAVHQSEVFIFGGPTAKGPFTFSVCANPNVPVGTVEAECKEECEDHFSGLGKVYIEAGCSAPGNCTSAAKGSRFSYDNATCTITFGPSVTPFRCDEADRIYDLAGGPLLVDVVHPPDTGLSELKLTIGDEEGSTPLSGSIGYGIVETPSGCPVDGCTIFITSMNLAGADFEIADEPITGLRASTVNRILGKWFPDGTAVFKKEDFALQTDFVLDGVRGSFRATPDADVVGFVDPSVDVFQFFSLTVTGPEDSEIELNLDAQLVASPPTAVIASKPSAVECNAPFSAIVTLDATQTTDPDGDLRDFLWGLEHGTDRTVLSEQPTPTVILPMGESTLILSAFDQRGWLGADDYSTVVADTLGPITACEDVEEECVGESTPVVVICTGTDVCDPGPTVSTDTLGSYPLGEHAFTCMATDAAGNTGDSSCAIRIVDTTPPVISPSPNSLLTECNPDPHLVTLPLPTVTDDCGQGDPMLSGSLIAFNNKPVVPPAQISTDGKLLLRPGAATVRWHAVDSSGNSTFVDQLFTITAVQGTACCKPGQTITQGTSAQDSIVKFSGTHCVLGKGAGDFLQTAGGNDVLIGNEGADNLTGGGGTDVLFGGSEADTVSCGYGGSYEAHGESGDDNVQAVFCSVAEIWGGTGNDNLTGSPGGDKIFPGPGIDAVNASGGNDLVTLYAACEAVSGKTLSGGPGQDVLVTPLSVSALQARGVQVAGFETIVIDTSKQYLSECF